MSLTRRALLSMSLLTVLVGCASTPEQPPPTRSAPPPGIYSLDAQTPELGQQHMRQRAIEALTIMTTWHTATDNTQTAADLRARSYFTEELAATVQAPERNGASGEFFAHPHSTSKPHILAVEGTDSLTPGSLAFEVTWEWIDQEGKTTPGDSVRLYNLAMTNTPAGWKISDYTYEEYLRRTSSSQSS